MLTTQVLAIELLVLVFCCLIGARFAVRWFEFTIFAFCGIVFAVLFGLVSLHL